MAPIIRVEHLRKVYQVGKEKVIALNDINLAIEPGRSCCIVGPSGSGKSTLLNQLAGLEKAHQRRGIHRQARHQFHDRKRTGKIPAGASGLYFPEL